MPNHPPPVQNSLFPFPEHGWAQGRPVLCCSCGHLSPSRGSYEATFAFTYTLLLHTTEYFPVPQLHVYRNSTPVCVVSVCGWDCHVCTGESLTSPCEQKQPRCHSADECTGPAHLPTTVKVPQRASKGLEPGVPLWFTSQASHM